MKSAKYYKTICFFNLLISFGVTLVSIFVMKIVWGDHQTVLLYSPFWIIFPSSFLALIFKNKFALERLSKFYIVFINLPSYFLVWIIVRLLGNSAEFKFSYENMHSLVVLYGLVISIFSIVTILILLIASIKHERNKTTEEMEINKILDKENLTVQEKEDFKSSLKDK